jgi:sugar lactone lactonase YvrE
MRGLAIPNGLGWSADGRTMYFTDSTWREVRAYPFHPATGAIGDGRTLLALSNDGGLPDGLTIDAEDHVWVACWGAGRVVRVAPDGVVVDRVELPVSQVTSCTFGGPDLADLYITTARERFDAADAAREPQAGGLFRCRPGMRGVPTVRFAG